MGGFFQKDDFRLPDIYHLNMYKESGRYLSAYTSPGGFHEWAEVKCGNGFRASFLGSPLAFGGSLITYMATPFLNGCAR